MQPPMHNAPSIEAQPTELIALFEAIMSTGSKSIKIYDMENKDTFPEKVKLGARSMRRVKAEVLKCLNEQLPACFVSPRALG